jgi:hypothetical protein
MFAVTVLSGFSDQITSGQTLAGGHVAHFDFGFFRQGDSGDARSITYNLENHTGGNLTITNVSVPVGFNVVSCPSPTTQLQVSADSQTLVVQMDKTLPGLHQGNVVVHSSDGDQVVFEITGTVGAYAAPSAYNLGSIGSAHRNDAIDYQSVSDYSGTAVLTPGVNIYRFDLAAPHNNVNLNLTKPAASDGIGVMMKIYRDANDDGILQVGEEHEIFPAAQVGGIGGQSAVLDSTATGTLAAGAYLIKCSPATSLLGSDSVSVAYNFTISAAALPDPKIEVQAAGKTAVSEGDLSPAIADGTEFGAAAVGSIARRDFVIKNSGSAPLLLSPAAFLSGNNGFAIDAGLPASIAPGGTARLGIRMLTSTAGSESAQVVIPTNDPSAPQFNFEVHGTVGAPGTPPVATLLTGLRVRTIGGTFYKFTIRYTDKTGVDMTSVNSQDIIVTGPGGFSSGVRLLTKTASNGGKTVDAFYRLAARDGTWDRGDNGLYTFNLGDGEIADLSGNPTPGAAVGQFTVRIPKTIAPAAAAAPMAVFSTKSVKDDDQPAAVWDN